jgi:hypothetical protein
VTFQQLQRNRTQAKDEARSRSTERARIAGLSDPELVAYLHCAASSGDPVRYRAAWHEAVTVRGAAGIPKLPVTASSPCGCLKCGCLARYCYCSCCCGKHR